MLKWKKCYEDSVVSPSYLNLLFVWRLATSTNITFTHYLKYWWISLVYTTSQIGKAISNSNYRYKTFWWCAKPTQLFLISFVKAYMDVTDRLKHLFFTERLQATASVICSRNVIYLPAGICHRFTLH